MTKYFCIMIFVLLTVFFIGAEESKQNIRPWDNSYQKLILKEVGAKLPDLVTYPSYMFPNHGHEAVVEKFPEGKVLMFGYGSLMSRESAKRTVKQEAVDSMQTAVAFGVKRVFNYHATKSPRWREDQDPKEKAMLNMVQTFKIDSMANGVLIEVDSEDLSELVKREVGYDLVPILVASWDDLVGQSPEINIKIAYTFVAINELREHIDYTSTEFYPVRWYLKMIQDTSLEFGEEFANMWNETTYLADGTTKIKEWDLKTFKSLLCTFRPNGKAPPKNMECD